ncbi:MAG: hypothetical protein J6J17_04155 [Bacilli bacterium]|nr:hypothetical protein [Bacilli bacterium]
MSNDIIVKDISQIDLKHSFFHYTSKQNLDTILKNGLEPRIGENSLYVEKTPKVFFVEGEKGIITIMDVWLRWLTSKSNVNKFVYWLGTFYMRTPFCVKGIPNSIVKKNLNNIKKRNKVYSKMKKILDNSIFLILDLEENIDFDYNDIDEVKDTYYESFLKLLYPSSSNIKDKKMEYWNMHTYSNKIINPLKISLLKNNDNYIANDILINIIENNIEYIKINCEFLYEYYIYIK